MPATLDAPAGAPPNVLSARQAAGLLGMTAAQFAGLVRDGAIRKIPAVPYRRPKSRPVKEERGPHPRFMIADVLRLRDGGLPAPRPAETPRVVESHTGRAARGKADAAAVAGLAKRKPTAKGGK